MFPWKSKNLYPILLTSLSAVMGVSMISPVLPQIQRTLELTDLQVGSIVTVYTMPAMLLAPLAGSLIDFYGRRTILIPSLILFGLSGFLISLVSSYDWIITLRIVQGIGGTSLALISRTLVGDVFSGNTQQSVMGLNDSTLALGAALFPFLGGNLALFGWPVPFRLYLFPVVAGVLTAFLLDGVDVKVTERPSTYVRNGLNLLLNGRTLVLLSSTFLSFFLLYGSIQTVAPLYLSSSMDYGSGTIGLLMTQMGLVMAGTSFFNGVFARFADVNTRVSTGFALYAIGLLILGGSGTYVSILAGFIAFGMGHGLLLPSLNTAIVRIVENDQRGAVMAYRTILARGGQTFGPVVFPVLGTTISYSRLFSLAGLLLLSVVLLVSLVLAGMSFWGEGQTGSNSVSN